MAARIWVPTLTGGHVSISLRTFAGDVVYRQRLAKYARELWAPVPEGRWNKGFPALYTSLSLEVALAERVKRTGGLPTEVVVGIAYVRLPGVGVLDSASLEAMGTPESDALAQDYTVPQHIGRLTYDAGVNGILVPAAIHVARLFPAILLRRDRSDITLVAPTSGTNLVIFPEKAGTLLSLEEIERFSCVAQGLRSY